MGSGQGRRRRTSSARKGGAATDFPRWTDFVYRMRTSKLKAGEYYEIELPDYGVPANTMEAERLKLARELLNDFVVSGALTLPKGVQLNELSFEISYDHRLMLSRVDDATGETIGDARMAAYSASGCLNNGLSLHGTEMRRMLKNFAEAI